MQQNENRPFASTGTQNAQPGQSGTPIFDHHRLDAFKVARQALVRADVLSRKLPRGYMLLGDHLRRSVLSAYLNVAEASGRSGMDRMARFRCARGEANEAAAAAEAVGLLGLATDAEIQPLLQLLNRMCAMLTRLGLSRR